MAPKDSFITAVPVERVTGQIGEAQKATCEVGSGIDRLRPGAGHAFRPCREAMRSAIRFSISRVRPSEQRVDYLSSVWVNLAGLPELSKRRFQATSLSTGTAG